MSSTQTETPASVLKENEKRNNTESVIAAEGLKFAQIPTFENPLQKRQWQLEHMAGAFRVFARKGYTEATSGHISYHFGMLKASDMVHVDELGNVIGGNRAAVNVAGFMIHSAIHKARPDVHAACHTHSVYGKAWSTCGKPNDIINQDACSFWKKHVVYRNFGGMVLEKEEGERIAEAEALWTRWQPYYTLFERACQVQLLVESTGLEKVIIGDEEAEYTQKAAIDPEALYTDFQPDFSYEVFKSGGKLLL
ncbi:hypothetical protein UA08_08449 [Talaromyces atroroseus]|uniref:Class II aldolase/adducin N-terminal domain-containing protein n=1 Tax=Talaromyces atroroseus TaxID=1441469 RepID=A0A1Q5Q7R5_TALAT|nr:hypothetical protein UA08_08449 [Talaromyces atroroseus]OKL56161.1 hypothetical protein UA08_08449 [Talaromyces atroroseus]